MCPPLLALLVGTPFLIFHTLGLFCSRPESPLDISPWLSWKTFPLYRLQTCPALVCQRVFPRTHVFPICPKLQSLNVELALCSGIGLLEGFSDAEASLTSSLTEGCGFCGHKSGFWLFLSCSFLITSPLLPITALPTITISLMKSWKLPGSIPQSLICPLVMPSYRPGWLPP